MVSRALETGQGLAEVTLTEYLQTSLLSMVSNDRIDIEQRVLYGGNVYTLHACVQQVDPGNQVTKVRNEV